MGRSPVPGNVVVPESSLLQIVGIELPVLGGRLEPIPELLQLVFGRDVQHDLQDPRAVVDQQPLEMVDTRIAFFDQRGRCQPLYLGDEDVLVMGAVEYTDHALGRGVRMDAPDKIVGPFQRAGGLEVGHRAPLRIDPDGHRFDGAVFARRVHALKDEAKPARLQRKGVPGARPGPLDSLSAALWPRPCPSPALRWAGSP
jgi:hypothetical protein